MQDLKTKIQKDGFIQVEVMGKSMEPLLKQKRDKIIIENINGKTINKLDIVLYQKENSYTLHRVIKIDDNKLYLRGDNNLASETILKEDVIGILKSYYHLNKYTEISKKINIKYYLYSLISYPFRLVKNKICK